MGPYGMDLNRLSKAVHWRERITIEEDKCGGKPCIRGMRVRVIDVLDLLANGMTREEIVVELPYLEPEDVEAAIKYARNRLNHPVLNIENLD